MAGQTHRAFLRTPFTGTGDGRASHAKLTAKGIKIIDKAIEIRFKIARDSLEGLKKREVTELAGMLKKVLETLNEY